jgi:hypothetical protein
LNFFTNSSATPSFVLTDAATANKIICNLFEPTTVNTEMIIKANNVLLGDTITHTLLSSATSQFFSGVVFNKPVQFLDGIDLGYNNADGTYTSTCIISKTGNGHINGNFSCGGILSTPNIYTKADTEDLLATK